MNRKGSGYVGSKGLLLDDCLHEIKRTRRYFDLPEPDFSLRDIERSALAKDAITALIKAIKKVHGSDVCARRNCFLEQGQNIFDDEPIGDPNWPRYRFLPSSLDWALRRTLEEAFQTIVQLPPRYPRPGISLEKITSVAARLNKCADDVSDIYGRWLDVDDRLKAALRFEDCNLLARQLKASVKLLEQAVLNASKVRVPRFTPPNPQVGMVLSIADWIECGTHQRLYKHLDNLAQAAFATAGKETPKWVGRLAVEASRKREMGKRWFRSVSTNSAPRHDSQ